MGNYVKRNQRVKDCKGNQYNRDMINRMHSQRISESEPILRSHCQQQEISLQLSGDIHIHAYEAAIIH